MHSHTEFAIIGIGGQLWKDTEENESPQAQNHETSRFRKGVPMNRTLLKIALAAVLLLSLLIFPACEKDQEPDTPTEAQTFPISAAFADWALSATFRLASRAEANTSSIFFFAVSEIRLSICCR